MGANSCCMLTVLLPVIPILRSTPLLFLSLIYEVRDYYIILKSGFERVKDCITKYQDIVIQSTKYKVH